MTRFTHVFFSMTLFFIHSGLSSADPAPLPSPVKPVRLIAMPCGITYGKKLVGASGSYHNPVTQKFGHYEPSEEFVYTASCLVVLSNGKAFLKSRDFVDWVQPGDPRTAREDAIRFVQDFSQTREARISQLRGVTYPVVLGGVSCRCDDGRLSCDVVKFGFEALSQEIIQNFSLEHPYVNDANARCQAFASRIEGGMDTHYNEYFSR